MKPIQLSAHTRPITKLRLNRDGDLLFTVSKDAKAMAWFMSDGMRLGTYEGHNGALNDFAVDFDSQFALTAGADCAVGVWETQTGENLRLLEPKGADRVTAVSWACGDQQFACSTLGNSKAYTMIFDFDADTFRDKEIPDEDLAWSMCIPPLEQEEFNGHTAKVSELIWDPTNEHILTASEDGTIRKWSVQTGELVNMIQFNPDRKVRVASLEYSKDKTLIIAAGGDCTARLYEGDTLTQLKVFESDKPLNCASLHPTLNLALVGGGQSARDVTTTGHGKGKFEIEFFHTIFEQKVGEIRTGHFSPINCVAISTDGSNFVTGAEEGNCRVFRFPPDFQQKFKSLEKSFVDMGGMN